MKAAQRTREAWLEEATKRLDGLFSDNDLVIPPTKISCGWPTKGATMSRKGRTLGQCFTKGCSTAGVNEIFISPVLSDSVEVLATLVHELCHAADNCASSHGPDFRKMMNKVGLEGKATATTASDSLKVTFKRLINGLGEYPHASLDVTRDIKKQSTRLLKATCPTCGYTVRVTKKWAEIALPICPIDDTPFQIAE